MSEGVDVPHDVMPELGLLLGGVVPVDVVHLASHLFQLLIGDVKPWNRKKWKTEIGKRKTENEKRDRKQKTENGNRKRKRDRKRKIKQKNEKGIGNGVENGNIN